jgi:hypothetical protein
MQSSEQVPAWRGQKLCKHCRERREHCTALHCTALHCTALHCTALHCTALHCIKSEKEPSWATTCSNCTKCSRSVSCFPPRNHILEQQSVSQSGTAVKAVGALCQWQLSVAAVSGSSVTDGSIELSVGRQSCLVS